MLHRARAAENAGQRVIVARGNRVKLVIVARGAAERLGQQRLADRIQLLINHVHAQLLFVLLLKVCVAQRQKGRGNALSPSVGGVSAGSRSPPTCSSIKRL